MKDRRRAGERVEVADGPPPSATRTQGQPKRPANKQTSNEEVTSMT
jgi:hypothetical protein